MVGILAIDTFLKLPCLVGWGGAHRIYGNVETMACAIDQLGNN